jgi:ribonuclease T2
MRLGERKRRLAEAAIVVCVLLGIWTVADARRPHHGDAYGGGRGPSVTGDFDYYLLSLSVAPSFCALDAGRREKTECVAPSDAAYRETPLTVHGLWPNRAGVGARGQPQDCEGPPLTALPERLRTDLVHYMPGAADGLDRYEWRKHGACSGLDPVEYFGAVVNAARDANRTIGAAMQSHGMFGRRVRVQELLDAVAETDAALSRSIVVDCRFAPKRSGAAASVAYISEIRVVLARDFASNVSETGWGPDGFVPLSEAGFRANSGCPSGAGFLPGGFEAS